MRARKVVGFALTSAILAVSFACSSVPDVTFSDSPTTPGQPEGGPVDGGNDVLAPGCNGQTDCDDPACNAGHACIDPPPAGWTPIILAPTSRPACPAGYTSPTQLRVVAGNGNYTCKCNCTPTGGQQPNCNGGSHTIQMGPDNTCGGGSETFQATTNTNCEMIGMFDAPNNARLVPPTGPTTCTGNDTDESSKVEAKDGVKCTSPAPAKGCNGGRLCKPNAPGFLLCVAKSGNETCPAGFTKQHRTGTTLNDGRICSGCACTTGPCTGEIELWSQPNCNGTLDSKITTAIHGTCASATTVNNVKSYKSKIGGGCTAGTSTTSGALDFGPTAETICCK